MAVYRSRYRKTLRHIFGSCLETTLNVHHATLFHVHFTMPALLSHLIFLSQFLLDKDMNSTFDAGWAVDDVRLLDCALPTSADCEEPQEEFTCPSGGCILLDSVCPVICLRELVPLAALLFGLDAFWLRHFGPMAIDLLEPII